MTLRPSWRKAIRSAGRRLPIVLPLAAVQFWLAGPISGHDSVFGWLLLVILFLVFALYDAYYIATVVRISADEVEVGVPLIFHTLLPRSAVEGVARRQVFAYIGTNAYTVIYGSGHRSIATLPDAIWDEADLERIVSHLGKHHSHDTKFVTSNQLGQEFPGALVWSRIGGWVLAVVVVVLIFVAAGTSRH